MPEYTLQDPPLRPRVGRRCPLGRATPSSSRSTLGARGDPQGQATRTGRSGSAAPAAPRSAAPAACGSTASPGLACNTHLDGERASSGLARRRRPIVVEPMGNMPVIKDLIVDMDAVHWKKIQRVTPWLINKEPIPEREYIVPHENMVDVTQTMACIQCGACVSDCLSMEVDPLFIGPAALAKAYRFVGDPRDAEHYERLKDLAEDPHGMYDCTHCFNCIDACPKGVAPMSQIMRLRRMRRRRRGDQRPQQRPPPREGVRRRSSRSTACSTRPSCCRAPTAATRGSASSPRGRARADRVAAGDHRGALRGKVTPEVALFGHKLRREDCKAVKKIFDKVEGTRGAHRAEPVHRRRYEDEAEDAETAPAEGADGGAGQAGPGPTARGERMKVAYWPGCVAAGSRPSCTARWRRSRRCSTSS